jgi:hypothetical protein
MTPTHAITSTDNLLASFTLRMSHLRTECEDIAEQWDGLGRAGGQREDHAASLLARLRPHLASIARLACDVEGQLNVMIADPWGRQDAA